MNTFAFAAVVVLLNPLTKGEIADWTPWAKRSVTKALADLREIDLIVSRCMYNGARRKEFVSKSDDSGESSVIKPGSG